MAPPATTLLRQIKQGVLIQIKAQAGARHSRIGRCEQNRLKIFVSEPPERGKANAAIIALLADALDIPRSRLCVHTGATLSRKSILVAGAQLAWVAEKLAVSDDGESAAKG